MGGPVAMGNWAVASIHVVKDTWGALRGTCWLAIKNRSPQQWAALGILQKGRHPHQAPPDLEGVSCSSSLAWGWRNFFCQPPRAGKVQKLMTLPPLSWAAEVTRADPLDWSWPRVEDLGRSTHTWATGGRISEWGGATLVGWKAREWLWSAGTFTWTLFQQCLHLGCMAGQTNWCFQLVARVDSSSQL